MLISTQLLKTVLLLKTGDTPHSGYASSAGRGVLRALWSAARQLAWGIDAASRVRHGIEVPPEHAARVRRRRPPSPGQLRL